MVVGEAIEMGLNLVVQLGLTTAPAETSAHTREEDSEPRHRSSCSSMRVMIATVRAQFSASALNCFFPARVIA